MPRCVTLRIHGAVQATGRRGQEGRSDVRDLLRHLGEARLDYHEIRRVERGEASVAALGIHGAPAHDGAERARIHGRSGPGALRVLLAASSPGAGATALTAALAQLVAQEGEGCAVIDLRPTGDLLRRLGVSSPRPCSDRCGGLHFSTDSGVLRHAAAGCTRSQGLAPLAAWHGIPELPDCGIVLLDVSPETVPAVAARVGLNAVVAVLRPSGGLCDALAAALEWERCAPVHLLLNGFDGRRASDRAARSALESRCGRRFLPMVIHEDAALAELPPGASLAERSPESQVLRDLADLTTWLRTRHG